MYSLRSNTIMNLQDIAAYILIGIAVIGCAYFAMKSRKEEGATKEPPEQKEK